MGRAGLSPWPRKGQPNIPSHDPTPTGAGSHFNFSASGASSFKGGRRFQQRLIILKTACRSLVAEVIQWEIGPLRPYFYWMPLPRPGGYRCRAFKGPAPVKLAWNPRHSANLRCFCDRRKHLKNYDHFRRLSPSLRCALLGAHRKRGFFLLKSSFFAMQPVSAFPKKTACIAKKVPFFPC